MTPSTESLLMEARRSHKAGDHALAERLYKDVLGTDPKNVAALYGFGFLCGARGDYEQAERLMGKAIAGDPNAPDAHFLRGSALMQLGRHGEAIAGFTAALALKPDFKEALLNRAACLFRLKRHAEAGEDYGRLLQLDPEFPYARGNRLFCRLQLCDWRDLEEETAAIAAALETSARVIAPFDAKALSLGPEAELRCAEIWCAGQVASHARTRMEPYRHKKVRVAYLTARFADDPVTALLAPVLECHDRARFEIAGVSFTGEVAENIHFERRIDAAGSDADIAARLRDAEIDIAVDLMGYTEGCRPGMFAARAAPVQVNYLGFPGTMGTPFMDYILADRSVIPQSDRRHYREQAVWLPCSFMPGVPRRAGTRAPSRAEAGLPERGFVFACFNNSYKFTPQIFALWMRLLAAVPDSALWLPKSGGAVIANLSREAGARGVDPRRLVFAPFVPAHADHLARLSLADVFLDTLPYNAHSSAADALAAGVPVLTCEGPSFAGRVAASLLRAAGLPELIAPSLAGYEALALKLAQDGVTLATLKAKLDSALVFDAERYTRNLEAAYTTMWRRAEEGLAPQAFTVGEGA